MPRCTLSTRTPTSQSSAISECRRLDAIARQRARRATAELQKMADDIEIRSSIIEEERLRRTVLADQTLRKEHPARWEFMEARRLARNRETAAVNRRLRAAGLRPMTLEPSLEQRVQELRRLESSNRAKTATRRGGR